MAGTLGTLFVLPRYQGMYQGVFAAGSTLTFTEAGTSTPLATYNSQDLSSANSDPVVADAYGLFGPIYLLDRAYKVVLKTSGGVEIWSQDGVRPQSTPALNRVDPSICDGRLTLTSGTPITTADVTAATTVYFTPYKGNKIALYSSVYGWDVLDFSELSIALGTDAASIGYDVFAYINAGAVAIERLAWTNGTTRATGLTTQNGVLVKSGDPTRRYLGSYYTTAIGQTEDSYANRLVYNEASPAPRPLRRLESTDSWAYSLATIRQANGSTANQLGIFVGVAERPLSVSVAALAASTSATDTLSVLIGEDSTTTKATGSLASTESAKAANAIGSVRASLETIPSVGYHFYAWLERTGTVGTVTWYGDNGAPTVTQAGMQGRWQA